MKTKTALLILLAGLSAFPSRAATVITTTDSNFGFSPDTSQDLILNVLPTSTGAAPNLATSGADPQLYTLVDGQAPIQIPNYNGNNLLQNGVVLVWDMGAPATINSIYTYSDWPNNGRVFQDYTVDVSADGTNWTTGVVAVVNQGTAASGNWPSVEVAVTTDDSSPLATNVRFIRFNFPSTQNGGVGYQEFVVNGVTTGLPQAPAFTRFSATTRLLRTTLVPLVESPGFRLGPDGMVAVVTTRITRCSTRRTAPISSGFGRWPTTQIKTMATPFC